MTNTNIVRVTKAQKFDAIISILSGNDEYTTIPAILNDDGSVRKEGVTLTPELLIEFCQNEKAALSRKSSTERKPTATQLENERFKSLILDFLAGVDSAHAMTATEIGKAIPELEGLSNQKISGQLRPLYNKGINPQIGRVMDGTTSRFYGLGNE